MVIVGAGVHDMSTNNFVRGQKHTEPQCQDLGVTLHDGGFVL